MEFERLVYLEGVLRYNQVFKRNRRVQLEAANDTVLA